MNAWSDFPSNPEAMEDRGLKDALTERAENLRPGTLRSAGSFFGRRRERVVNLAREKAEMQMVTIVAVKPG